MAQKVIREFIDDIAREIYWIITSPPETQPSAA